jgi:hypothetical protein
MEKTIPELFPAGRAGQEEATAGEVESIMEDTEATIHGCTNNRSIIRYE